MMDNSQVAVAGRSRAAEVYADLRHKVVGGILTPGSRLSPAALAKGYDVSATVVREALTRLTGERFARCSPQQGFTIATATNEEFVSLMKVRTLIDSEGLSLSVAKGGLAWKGALVSAHYMLSNASASDEAAPGTVVKFGYVYQNFHAAMISGCGNPCLISTSRQLYDETEIYRHYLRVLDPHTLERSSEHDRLLEAALAGNAEEAVAMLVAHYDKSMRGLVDSAILRNSPPIAAIDSPKPTKRVAGGNSIARKPKALRSGR